MTATHDVVVVGGGAVGAALALALRGAGFGVALVERGAPPRAFDPAGYDLRVFALAPSSVRLLERLGVWPRIRAARVCAYRDMRVWEDHPDEELHFSAAETGVPELGCIVENSLLVAELWRALGDLPVHANDSVAAADFAGPAVRLRLASGAGLACSLVVSAEGADSALRESAGIDTHGWSYAQRAIVCHVTTGDAHGATAWQRFLATGPLAFLPLADGRCSIVWSVDEQEAAGLLALDDAEFRRRLGEAFQLRLGAVTGATPRLSFPLRLQHATDYVREGLALVGDSAHVVHPLAGQGLNLGLADVEALVAVLAHARSRGQPPGALRVLRRYERARRAENVEMLALTDALYRAFASRIPAWGRIRRVGFRAVSQLRILRSELARRAMGL